MPTFRLPILGTGFTPDTTGKAWVEPYVILATNDFFRMLVGRIDEDGNNNAQLTSKAGFYGRYTVPKNFTGTTTIVIVWTATVTSGNVVWDFDYRAVGGDDSESLDSASGYQESVTVTDAAPTAANNRLEVSVAITAGNFAADRTVEFFLSNDGGDAADTLAGARLLVDAYFQYTGT